MPIPDFITEIRALVGHHPLWLPGVTAVVRRDDRILLVQRADNGAWTPVTGIPEPGEEPAVAAVREVLEETGVVVRVHRLASTWVHGPVTHANGDLATYLDLTFACTWLEGEAHVADDESRDVAWVRRTDLAARGLSDEMLRRIDAALSDEDAARFVQPDQGSA
jgi:8-oxo-dGTP pyrophosphatase MutT (NUDIX family)